MVAALEINNVSKRFPDKDQVSTHEVLSGISFKAKAGEFISLIGPSGCGKTTLLRIVQGLELRRVEGIGRRKHAVGQAADHRYGLAT